MSSAPEHRIWAGMKTRCYNPNAEHFERYGGRGIAVCWRWRNDFAAFFADMGPRPSVNHSIERRDNDAGYSPDNCYWATQKEQTRNTRRNHRLTWNGDSLTMADWDIKLGFPKDTVKARINRRKWTIERALTQPVRRHG
jgi:hypothetical protein